MAKKAVQATPNRRLKEERELRGWSQKYVADQIGAECYYISRWERGTTFPSSHYRIQLCQLFNKNAKELGLQQETVLETPQPVYPPPSPLLWHIPFRRNPCFTGRELVLKRVREKVCSANIASVQPVAITGLGGIGKTHVAIEYAYRYRHNYQAVIWLQAETYELLVSDIVAVVGLLNIPEKEEQDQKRVVAGVKRWLSEHSNWLLILDNVEDFAVVHDFLPAEILGHVLLTTRMQSTGILAQRVDLENMQPDESVLFLLRRAKLIASEASLEDVSPTDYNPAKAISSLMDGLPLALDQAGAYIEETECSLSDYLNRYQQQRATLLNLRNVYSNTTAEHPQSVTTTLLLSIMRVEQAQPAAVALLRLCAFLHPDAIPEEIFTKAAPELHPVLQSILGDLLKVDAAIAVLRTYSLLRRNPDNKTLTIHRLVQAVLKDSMDEKTQHLWAEQAVCIINRVFPDVEQMVVWSQSQRYLSQAQTCANLIEQWHMEFQEAGQLLHQTGIYMREYAQYTQAAFLIGRACDIRTRVLGPEHADVAESLNELAAVYRVQSKYTQAEPLYLQALAIREQQFAHNPLNVAQSLNDLALLYHFQGKYAQAEPLFLRSLTICELKAASKPLSLPTVLNNLALFYDDQGKYTQAEILHQRALVLWEQILGPEHPSVALALNNLAFCYNLQGKYEQAEPLHQRALAIREKAWGLEHPDVANSLNNLAWLYNRQGKSQQAEPLHRRALAIREKVLGPEHPDVAVSLSNLAKLYYAQGNYTQAEPLHLRALLIREKVLGPEHPGVAVCLSDLAMLYKDQGNYAQAEPLFQRTLSIREKALGLEHPDVIATLENYAILLYAMQRETEASQLRERAMKPVKYTQ